MIKKRRPFYIGDIVLQRSIKDPGTILNVGLIIKENRNHESGCSMYTIRFNPPLNIIERNAFVLEDAREWMVISKRCEN